MADRRMFAKSIVLSDAFLDMPMSARCLYFTLGMLADDDGFVGSPKSIMRQCGASLDDMNILLAKRYVLGFDSGIIVIKHWRINNYLQKDRYKSTTYIEERETLKLDLKGAYTEADGEAVSTLYTDCIQNGDTGKDRIGKDNIIPPIVPPKGRTAFQKPTLDEVKAYCQERDNGIDPESFIAFYESNGWKVGKNPMKDWKAAVRTWEARRKEEAKPKQRSNKMVEDLEERIRLNASIDPRTGEPIRTAQ